jgi:5-methyltetrahydrofolate--homocysteine methyltransferase
MSKIMSVIQDRVLLSDGGLGTQVFLKKPAVEDYGGAEYEGCIDLLSERRPDWIKEIHATYFDAGSDSVETNTFGANPLVLSEYGLADKAESLNIQSAQLAREVARSYDSPRFVLGSVGPGTKLVTLGHVDHQTLFQSYLVQMRGLLKGSVDAILIETCQDLGQMKIAVRAAKTAMAELKTKAPIWVQATMESSGTLLAGSDLQSVLVSLEAVGIDVLGLNCSSGPDEMARHLEILSEQSPLPISCLPNAGLPINENGNLVYAMTPEIFAEKVENLTKRFGLSIVGGCCGTTPGHIRALSARVGNLPAPRRNPRLERGAASLYQTVPYRQEPKPLIIGERTNANGSKKFRDLLALEDWDSLVGIAREQQSEGAHRLDVCVAFTGRDEARDMEQFLSRLVTRITMPLMIDSTEVSVIETALQTAPGKCLVNSINFEDGEARARQILDLCKQYGAAVLALTIDEQGMAKTLERKKAVTERFFNLVVGEYSFHPSDLIIDPLTFTLASGDEEFRNSAKVTLEAIKEIKQRWPEVLTSLGVSNVSFGLSPAARRLLNALMLYHAVRAGLDMAIFNAGKVIPIARIDADSRKLFEDLIFDNRGTDYDPLKLIVTQFAGKKEAATISLREGMDIETRLKHDIINGERGFIIEDIDKALAADLRPQHLINNVLLEGMKIVGKRFGAGEMQLPFVLESAETMKAAIKRLAPHMAQDGAKAKGRMILATVVGDVHDIGKNLVEIILSNNGFEVENLGVKQPIEDILNALEARPADAIGLSGLLVKSTVVMKENLAHMRQRGYHVPVILGGAALTRDFVETACRNEYQCDAVFYAEDAFDGLKHMENIVSGAMGETAQTLNAPSVISGQDKQTYDEPPAELTNEGQSAWVTRQQIVPEPPFWGVKDIIPPISEVLSLINDAALMQSRWAFKKGALTDEQFKAVMGEKAEPLLAMWKERAVNENLFAPRARYGYFPAQAMGSLLNVFSEDRSEVIAVFDFPRQSSGKRLALSDFFNPPSRGFDLLPLQIVTLGHEVQTKTADLYRENRYSDYLYLHGLAAEFTESCAKWLFMRIKTELGVTGGQRYSFGYPACPDLAGNGAILSLLEGDSLGVSITGSLQLEPVFTTCALVAWHPQAAHFIVGHPDFNTLF